MPAGIGNEMNDLTRTLIVLAVSKVQIYWPQHFSVTAIAVYKTEDPAGGEKKWKYWGTFALEVDLNAGVPLLFFILFTRASIPDVYFEEMLLSPEAIYKKIFRKGSLLRLRAQEDSLTPL